MSLYDDCDVKTRAAENVQGWSSGIKLLQSQLQLKKATITQPRRDLQKKVSLPPVIDLKAKRDEDDIYPIYSKPKTETNNWTILSNSTGTYGCEYDWNVVDEYDPLWPNEYEKVVKDLRDHRERENEKDNKRRDNKRRKSRFSDHEDDSPPPPSSSAPQMTQPTIGSGFAGRWEAEEDLEPVVKAARSVGSGAAIAPPPSLQETTESVPVFPSKPQTAPPTYGGGSVAAKIMAKYGFKEGQGLGKQEQGMASALQVEKTSKRGGRIIHEKEIIPAFEPAMMQPASVTDIMKNPSKVCSITTNTCLWL